MGTNGFMIKCMIVTTLLDHKETIDDLGVYGITLLDASTSVDHASRNSRLKHRTWKPSLRGSIGYLMR